MNIIKTYISGILAGICISVGGAVFLSLENHVLGALFFCVGLFTICTLGFDLYTGKVAYVLKEKSKEYVLNLPAIWLGNLTGCFFCAAFLFQSRIGDSLYEKAVILCGNKLNDDYISLFILGVFCNILIYIAVEGFKNNPHEIGKYLSLFFGVMVFILCGFEHCIADMFYLFMGKGFGRDGIMVVLVVTLGNTVGGVLIPTVREFIS